MGLYLVIAVAFSGHSSLGLLHHRHEVGLINFPGRSAVPSRVLHIFLEGAGVGTVAGVAAGGGKGAAIGAAAGAGAGLGAGILTDRNFRLEKGTQLEVQLDRPLMVPR
jgi:hypothetical protein